MGSLLVLFVLSPDQLLFVLLLEGYLTRRVFTPMLPFYTSNGRHCIKLDQNYLLLVAQTFTGKYYCSTRDHFPFLRRVRASHLTGIHHKRYVRYPGVYPHPVGVSATLHALHRAALFRSSALLCSKQGIPVSSAVKHCFSLLLFQ